MNNEFIKKLTDLVETNLVNENFGIENLAREMGSSHSSLHRKLKSITNRTINQFIREIRLKKARELLQNEDLTVSEIAYRVGFASPTYFNKCFHEYFGFPPGESKHREEINKSFEEVVDIIPMKRNHTKNLVFLIFSFLIIASSSVYLINRAFVLYTETVRERSIALLPFKLLSDETGKQYLADSLMDAILLHLSKINDMRIISRTSVEQYRQTNKTSKAIGKELDVSYLLEGSFIKVGDHVQIILQLIKTSDESHLWVNEYNRDWTDIISIQNELAETIANQLDSVITPQRM
jgi:TolB-like protein/AraC-like DNA-binding protein